MALPILDGNQSATTLSTILSGGEHTPAHTVVSLGSTAIANITSAVSGVQIGGTVTANVQGATLNSDYYDSANDWHLQRTIPHIELVAGETAAVASNNPLPISGTVTANLGGIAGGVTMPVRLFAEQSGGPTTGQDTLLVCDSSGRLNVGLYSSAGGTDAISYDGSDSFVKTKNLANPSGALTTRFGSVTTANTAQITSAVTNASRKFLLVQNIATSTVTIGIGFSPTTTQGIQLASGAGLTFDAFCPTGAVYWLSGVTGTNWSVLEG
ncbi:MAG: hypothetical protein EBR82_47450 [Caulobacteraceae bacterium]|nr:hypothetical protein [Caulobacteraceae bacterium]